MAIESPQTTWVKLLVWMWREYSNYIKERQPTWEYWSNSQLECWYHFKFYPIGICDDIWLRWAFPFRIYFTGGVPTKTCYNVQSWSRLFLSARVSFWWFWTTQRSFDNSAKKPHLQILVFQRYEIKYLQAIPVTIKIFQKHAYAFQIS